MDNESLGIKGTDTNALIKKVSTRRNINKNDKKKLRPKLKPMPSPSNDLNSRSPLDELAFGNFTTAMTSPTKTRHHWQQSLSLLSPEGVPNAQDAASTLLRIKAQPRTKIQPHLFSPDKSPGNNMYITFGFGHIGADHPMGGMMTTGAKRGGSDYWDEEAEALPHAFILVPPLHLHWLVVVLPLVVLPLPPPLVL